MKVEDTLKLTRKTNGSHAVHVGDKFSSVADKDIEDLFVLFERHHIPIDLANSEKRISFMVEGKKKQSFVPIEADVYSPVVVNSYILRSGKLEVSVEDYYKSNAFLGLPRGGDYSVEGGIVCKIRSEGEDTNLVKKIKGILKDFYD